LHAADIKFSGDRLKEQAGKALWEVERQKLHELLDQYLLVLVQAGVSFPLILLIFSLITD
jgi:hypothetical protein